MPLPLHELSIPIFEDLTMVVVVMMMIRIKTMKLLIISKSSIPPLPLTYDQVQIKLKFISPADSVPKKAHTDNRELVAPPRYAIHNRGRHVITVYLRVSSCGCVCLCEQSGLWGELNNKHVTEYNTSNDIKYKTNFFQTALRLSSNIDRRSIPGM
jgi:hypothetical protein